MVGNLTILYTLVLPYSNRVSSQGSNYYDRPAIETTERYVSRSVCLLFIIPFCLILVWRLLRV